MTVLGSGDKHYLPKVIEDNDKYYDVLDKLVDDLLTKKIHNLSIGFDYQYIVFKGNIKVKKQKIHDRDYLSISNDGVNFDMNYNQFTEIIIRRTGIVEIETHGGGIVFDFGKVKK